MSKLKYGVDTVAFLRYLTDTLGPDASKIFELAEIDEVELIFPSITIGELIYTIEKEKEITGKVINKKDLEMVISSIITTSNFRIVDLDYSNWLSFLDLKIPELHDRIIVAICLQEEVEALLTTDPEIQSYNLISTIW